MDASTLLLSSHGHTKREEAGTENISLDLRRSSSTSTSTSTLRDVEQSEPLIAHEHGNGEREDTDVDLEGLKEVLGRRRESEESQLQPAKISPWIMSTSGIPTCTLHNDELKNAMRVRGL